MRGSTDLRAGVMHVRLPLVTLQHQTNLQSLPHLRVGVLHERLPLVVLLEDRDLDDLAIALKNLVDVVDVDVILVVVDLRRTWQESMLLQVGKALPGSVV
jgi:hypothetical protein